MAHLVVWPKCSVDNPDTGEAVVLNAGQLLPAWVNDFTKFVLVQTGGVKVVPDDTAATAPSPDPVRLTEHPALDSNFAAAEKGTLAGDAAARLAEAKTSVNDARPSPSASKADWVAYAVAQRAEGVSEEDATAEAEAMTKADLIAAYGG
jgi:hypothetical protein